MSPTEPASETVAERPIVDARSVVADDVPNVVPTPKPTRAGARPTGMSYKFQRLRERLREAVRSGELTGKLPGERALAKRFQVNAKTLSKALTDLAAEGLLDRSIGRGTYVKGSSPVPQISSRWLVVCDAGAEPCMVGHLRNENGQLEVITDVTNLRPSYLNQFDALIDAAGETPEEFLRDMVVRNVPVIALGREPRTYSVHSVLPDVSLAVTRIGRELMLAGHRRVAVVESAGQSALAQTLRLAGRHATETTVDSCHVKDVSAMIEEGVSAIVCETPQSARAVCQAAEARGLVAGRDFSLAAVGCLCEEAPCSGWFVPCRQIIGAVLGLLRDGSTRPTTLWLAGESFDHGTIVAAHDNPSNGDGIGRGHAVELQGLMS